MKSWFSSITVASTFLLYLSSVTADITSNSTQLWGTYRPNLYFGTRPRLPESVMTGLMWFDPSHVQGFQRMRHSCDQGDGMAGYGYLKHDGREFAFQEINDKPTNVKLSTEFIHIPGGSHGGDWGVRIRGTPLNEQGNELTSVLFYIGVEGQGGIDIMSKLSRKGLESPIKLEGDTPDLGEFEFQIVDGPLNSSPTDHLDQDLSKTQWYGTEIPEGDVWRSKDYVMEDLLGHAKHLISKDQAYQREFMESPHKFFTLSNTLDEEEGEVANFYVFQKTYEGEFQFDVLFHSSSTPEAITSEVLGERLLTKEKEFNDRFESVFELKEKGFNRDQIEFGQYLLSNLLGGIGYFHGSSLIEGQESQAQTLFTATPSRPFFPRGFYWDEGFHQLLIGEWDNDLSLDMIRHWTDLIDQEGWVAREQILGAEARSKVPSEFQTQFRHYANPPTLYLAIRRFIDRLDRPQAAFKSHTHDRYLGQLGLEWLSEVYPKLRQNWLWFRRTQLGQFPDTYRWRGRTANHTLTSGLDDYPRGQVGSDELHLDLQSWMAFATGLLQDIAQRLGLTQDLEEYGQVKTRLLDQLERYWSSDDQMFCDRQGPAYVCHKGYLSLFPLSLGLVLPEDPRLEKILDLIEGDLWSSFGLRSLSTEDPYYGLGEDYWRGPIWINLNYLALQSLYKNYMHVPGPYQKRCTEIYTKLRHNLIQNVYTDYKKTGYVWEQYDDKDGHGKRSHPFTGWTSLILLVMSEKY